ncbi:HPr family phosphocarrier protein [Paenibacillus sp. GCM10027626]|uniref:HPr family phosphocarrier protein n=1 Tax=Paenibacillus sp. GCM10027626 TaxID=3273411 RepID=UPI003626DE04
MYRRFIIQNPAGIHARPARIIAETAKRYPCEIYFMKNGIRFNAKSILNVMTLCAKFGDEVVVAAEGEQADCAVEALGALLNSSH